MPTYLMTWNPDRWAWEEIGDAAEATAAGEGYQSRWSSGNTKTIKRGERVFLLRQGQEPKGIVGTGWTTSDSYEADHWNEKGGMAA